RVIERDRAVLELHRRVGEETGPGEAAVVRDRAVVDLDRLAGTAPGEYRAPVPGVVVRQRRVENQRAPIDECPAAEAAGAEIRRGAIGDRAVFRDQRSPDVDAGAAPLAVRRVRIADVARRNDA